MAVFRPLYSLQMVNAGRSYFMGGNVSATCEPLPVGIHASLYMRGRRRHHYLIEWMHISIRTYDCRGLGLEFR